MAIIKVVKKSGKTKTSLKSAVEYIGEKACNTFGINCSNDYHQIVNNFYETKEYFNKLDGRQYRHYIQSFAPNEISKNEIMEVANRWAEKVFEGHEVYIAIHDDKDHLHAHFIVNSVNFINGKKLHESKKELEYKKEINDEICREFGIKQVEKNRKIGDIVVYDKDKYEVIKKGADITSLAEKILEVSKVATSKKEFIAKLEKEGYGIDWNDNKKNITFSIPVSILKGKKNKFRLSNLEKTFNIPLFTKENLIEKFEINKSMANNIKLEDINKKMGYFPEEKKIITEVERKIEINSFKISKNNGIEL